MTPALFCTLKLKPQTTSHILRHIQIRLSSILIQYYDNLHEKFHFCRQNICFGQTLYYPRVTWRDLSMEITYNNGTFFYNLNLPSAIVHKRNYMKKYRIYLQNRHGTLYKIHELSSGNGEIRCIVGIPTVLYLGLIFLKTQRIRSGVLITRENLKLWR